METSIRVLQPCTLPSAVLPVSVLFYVAIEIGYLLGCPVRPCRQFPPPSRQFDKLGRVCLVDSGRQGRHNLPQVSSGAPGTFWLA